MKILDIISCILILVLFVIGILFLVDGVNEGLILMFFAVMFYIIMAKTE